LGSSSLFIATNPAGSSVWSSLLSASANLTLNNADFSTTFNQTSAVNWTWANTTPATSGTSQSSPILNIKGSYWNGSASASDSWTIQDVVAAGTNGASTLTFTHSGSTGVAAVKVPNLLCANVGANGNALTGVYVGYTVIATTSGWSTYSDGNGGSHGVQFYASAANTPFVLNGYFLGFEAQTYPPSTAPDTGISRLAAASLAIGNGTAGDTTGNLSFGKVIKYNGVSTVRAGVPSIVATIALTAQSAAIANGTALYSVPAGGAGLYRVTVYAKITTASDISSTLGGAGGFTLTWTDPTDSTNPSAVTFSDQSSQSLTGNTTTTVYVTTATVECKASTNLQYGFGYTDTHTSTAMAYKLSISVEYIG
jgi:hypothetical protein